MFLIINNPLRSLGSIKLELKLLSVDQNNPTEPYRNSPLVARDDNSHPLINLDGFMENA